MATAFSGRPKQVAPFGSLNSVTRGASMDSRPTEESGPLSEKVFSERGFSDYGAMEKMQRAATVPEGPR
jgi:hypothetical protein